MVGVHMSSHMLCRARTRTLCCNSCQPMQYNHHCRHNSRSLHGRSNIRHQLRYTLQHHRDGRMYSHQHLHSNYYANQCKNTHAYQNRRANLGMSRSGSCNFRVGDSMMSCSHLYTHKDFLHNPSYGMPALDNHRKHCNRFHQAGQL